MHVIPQLRKLEEKYQQELVIIGVHAGKFLVERQTANIRQAVLRLEVDHPVVNDRQYRIWRSYGVSAWPTIVLIDPEGGYVGSQPGEITFEAFDPIVGRMIADFDAVGRIDRTPLVVSLEKQKEPTRPLAFPGKVLASSDGRLFIADTNHNRILVLKLDDSGEEGTLQETIGAGQIGMQDGSFSSATFNHPQGLALDGNVLYIADMENHAIRAANLVTRQVETVAGTGQQGRGLGMVEMGGKVSLSSPWDLAIHEGVLYIAMAGYHQLWAMGLASRRIVPFAGTGREDLKDGPLATANLAQPMGITGDGRRIYFADSESSAIRWADLDLPKQIGTIVGKGLFDYGDKDGVGENALLEHSQGVAWDGGKVYVADTYNNKIKVIDLASRQVTTFLGTGESGLKDGDQAQFYEPGGVSVANGRLYIADTNNHTIRVADLATGRVSSVRLRGL